MVPGNLAAPPQSFTSHKICAEAPAALSIQCSVDRGGSEESKTETGVDLARIMTAVCSAVRPLGTLSVARPRDELGFVPDTGPELELLMEAATELS
jgi:hypothetical protein